MWVRVAYHRLRMKIYMNPNQFVDNLDLKESHWCTCAMMLVALPRGSLKTSRGPMINFLTPLRLVE